MIVKQPFTIEGYLGGYKDATVVDKKGKKVDVEGLTLHELSKKEEKEELFFQIDGPDRSLYLVKNTEVSDRAKDFIKTMRSREDVEKIAGWFMSLVGYLATMHSSQRNFGERLKVSKRKTKQRLF